MFLPYEVYIGLRYTRAKRRNHFISLISVISMLGVALGVWALITVISVMNGFEMELRERFLSMAAHNTIQHIDDALADWPSVIARVKQHPRVVDAAPYVQTEAMLTRNKQVNGAIVRGILPGEEPKVAEIADKMVEGRLTDLHAGEFGIILGKDLARILGVITGDKVTLIAPKVTITPVGILPRLKRFTVVGIFEVGMYEYDSAMAYIHMADAARLLRMGKNITGIRLKIDDVMSAPSVSRDLSMKLPPVFLISDWTRRHANLFKAIKTEKTVMFIILSLIVAVAAFNIVSTLVMVVTDKQSDIAVLRTIGASPRSIMVIFIVLGTIIGVVGTLVGAITGVWTALNVETVVPVIESLIGFKFLNPEVYYISELPSDMHWRDVVVISGIAFGLSIIATLYPAWRAARTQPAEALRYE